MRNYAMTYDVSTQCVAFVGDTLLAAGRLDDVVVIAKQAFDTDSAVSSLVFDATTSARIDVNLGGTIEQVRARLPLAPHPPIRGPGRPKLGVVAREVTLLPRHWEWLATQPGGASVALRKLVEQARIAGSSSDDVRKSKEAVYKFMTALGGDNVGYEDATRALFAGNKTDFINLIETWPADVRTHLVHLAEAAFGQSM
jgi:uncharacterized protein